MKLMSYNIYDGAPGRWDYVIEAVQKEAPDFLTINEANTFAKDNNKLLKEVAAKIALPYFYIALSGEYDYHVAIFSKFEIKQVYKLQPLMRACLITSIQTDLGPISIASLHLTPYTEDLRHPEIDLILDFQKKFDNKILMGDMNSLSQHDGYNNSIVKTFNDQQIKKFTSNGELRFDAIQKIESHGYFDTAVKMGKNKENTVPTNLNEDNAHGKMRLDYIFISESLITHLKNYDVVKNELTEKASDHYPIVIELN